MSARPLTARQQRAASLLGRGWQSRRVALEVGVHPRTVSTWKRRDDFATIVRQQREAVVAETPTAQATLEGALSATTASGAPDWRTRVSAARALIGADGPAELAPVRETVIHAGMLDDGDAR